MVNKKAQLTIFIIIAIALAIVVLLLFLERGNLQTIFTSETPVDSLKKCITGDVSDTGSLKNLISKLSNQGGSLNPENYYLYDGNKIDYVCYTEQNYKTCIMQKPFLKQDIENELKEAIKPKVDSCINSFKDSSEKKGYTISFKKPVISVELVPNSAIVSLNEMDLKVTKEKTESYKSLKNEMSSKLYNFVMIVSSISNWEARFGSTNIMSYMIYYPSLKVEPKKQSEGTTIYILTDKNSGEKFMFASRSLVLPSGISGK